MTFNIFPELNIQITDPKTALTSDEIQVLQQQHWILKYISSSENIYLRPSLNSLLILSFFSLAIFVSLSTTFTQIMREHLFLTLCDVLFGLTTFVFWYSIARITDLQYINQNSLNKREILTLNHPKAHTYLQEIQLQNRPLLRGELTEIENIVYGQFLSQASFKVKENQSTVESITNFPQYLRSFVQDCHNIQSPYSWQYRKLLSIQRSIEIKRKSKIVR